MSLDAQAAGSEEEEDGGAQARAVPGHGHRAAFVVYNSTQFFTSIRNPPRELPSFPKTVMCKPFARWLFESLQVTGFYLI
jgi:hypothetical protein